MASSLEPGSGSDTQKSLAAPPPLPAQLQAVPPLVYAGTAIWFVAFCVLAVLRYGYDVGRPIWLWTTLAGTVLGCIGMPIMWWQRAASRRGSRSAQRNL